MNKLFSIFILVVLVLIAAQYFVATTAPIAEEEVVAITDPLNARITIEGREFALVDGRYGDTTETVTVFGEPVLRDVDGDYDDDAVMLVVHEPGGSGSFYYVVAALKDGEEYVGTNAVLLGDRIAPQNVVVRNRVIMANFADRRAEDPMTAQPSEAQTAYIVYADGALVRAAEKLEPGTQIIQGYLTWGGEVRTFRACGEGQPEHWIIGTSPANDIVRETYEREVVGAAPYTPLFVTIAGAVVPAPEDGFGADYDFGIRVDELISVDRHITCKSDTVVLTSPRAGTAIESPLTVTGFVRGAWAFEGDFPVTLVDWDGLIIAEGYATVLADWMTDEYVPFLGTLEFSAASTTTAVSSRAAIILQKDNASGLPEHDDVLEVPVVFR